jgi:hypothetical protein
MFTIIIIIVLLFSFLALGLAWFVFAPQVESSKGAISLFSKGDEYKPLITGILDETYIALAPEVGGGYYAYLKIEPVDLMDISDQQLEQRIRGFAKFLEHNVRGIQLLSFATKIDSTPQRQHLTRRMAKAKTEKDLALLQTEMEKIYQAEITDQQKVFYVKVFGKTLKSLKKSLLLLEALSTDFPYQQVVGRNKIIEIEQKLAGTR